MNVEELKSVIRKVFHGVKLEDGVSLKQGEICDNYGKDNNGREVTKIEYLNIPKSEITDNWESLTLEYLDQYPTLSYQDAKGFRYYIPAFLLSLLSFYDSGSSRSIGTLSSLYPEMGQLFEYHMSQYSLLNPEQRQAIALYLREFPNLVSLKGEDVKVVNRAFENYWKDFLPPGI